MTNRETAPVGFRKLGVLVVFQEKRLIGIETGTGGSVEMSIAGSILGFLLMLESHQVLDLV